MLVGIVAAVIGLWLVGAMSPATLVGTDSGPIFPFSDQSEDGVLEVSVNESSVDPGDPVTVTVTIDRSPTSDATVSVDGTEYEVGGDGTVVVELDDPGEYTVRASGPDGERSATAEVRVRRYQTSLTVSLPDEAVTGEPVPVRVERADGQAVTATVSAGGQQVRTGQDGVANVTFERAGDLEVRASKSDTETYTFEDAVANVSVERREVALAVSTNGTDPRVDEPVVLTVTRQDTGEPVNATVAVGDRTVTTGDDGAATVTFDRGGRVRVEASADPTPAVRFGPTTARLSVERLPVNLTVSASPNPVAEGERATFVVRRADTGERVSATLSMFGSTYATGANGTVSFPFYAPANATVEATKEPTDRERFRPAETRFVVEGPEVVVDSLSVPETAPAGEPMEVTATLSNVGTTGFDDEAVVTVGGETTRVPVSLASGETDTVTWSVDTPDETGNATVTVDVEEATVERAVRLTGNASTATASFAPDRPGGASWDPAATRAGSVTL